MSVHLFAAGALALATAFVAAVPAAAVSTAPITQVDFKGYGVVRSNYVTCYFDYDLYKEVCLEPSDFNLPAPGQKVLISGSYTPYPFSDPIPRRGDYVYPIEAYNFQFHMTPTDGSQSFSYFGESFGRTISFHNGRITALAAEGITHDDCGFDKYISFTGSAKPWSGGFAFDYCAFIESTEPRYGVGGNWQMSAYRLDGEPWISVPEPASWAMLVGGFVLVGGALRRRRPMVTA